MEEAVGNADHLFVINIIFGPAFISPSLLQCPGNTSFSFPYPKNRFSSNL